MQLNELERKFFAQILNAELDIPLHATLKYEDDVFEVILVPELTGEGEFRLRYFNASAYVPQTQFNESGIGTKRWSMREAAGLHPSLERAWLSSDRVTAQMRPSPVPMDPVAPPELSVRVIYAASGNRGELGLERNEVALRPSLLRSAEFSLVGFPRFELPSAHLATVTEISDPEREVLRNLGSRLEGRYRLDLTPFPQRVVLDSGDGWIVKLTRDQEETRDMLGHTGLIGKAADEEFDTCELGNLLEGLKYFLAYVAGAYCHPTAVIGHDSKNRPVWGQIGLFASDPHKLPNWFNYNGARLGSALEALFPSFWREWSRSKAEMVAILECYIHSNAMGRAGIAKDAVAKSYAGLEMLASLALNKTIRGDSGKEIHKVLSYYQIPNLHLGQSKTPTMARLCDNLDEPAKRGPYLLSGVRNYVAHPLDPKTPAEVKKRYLQYLDADTTNYFYLHDLSQFYLGNL